MMHEKEMTTLNPSVAADGEQSLTKDKAIITENGSAVNGEDVNLVNDNLLASSIGNSFVGRELSRQRVEIFRQRMDK